MLGPVSGEPASGAGLLRLVGVGRTMDPDARDPWIFGYGSLVWRPAFPFVERHAGWVRGWSRRFWQSSSDHRGVPEDPGRVVTLIPDDAARCWGIFPPIRPTCSWA